MSKGFVFNNSDPVYMMRQKLEQFFLSAKSDKYEFALKFMNNLFCVKNRSLKDFKNINTSVLDIDYAIEIIEKYKIIKKFNIQMDEDNVTIKDIFDIIKTVLKPAEFTFSRRRSDGMYYTREIG